VTARATLPDKLDPGITEAKFGKLIEQCADENGWLWCHVRPLKVPGRGGKFITPAATGFPDYVMVHPRINGMFVLEIKSAGGKCSAKQKRWLQLLGRVESIDAFAAWPADWPHVRNYLEAAPPVRNPGVANSPDDV